MTASEALVVLRFRDLGLPTGETVTRHRREIARHDQCWWGWWARAHEKSPTNVQELDFPRTFALFDTDQMLVYAAVCKAAAVTRQDVLSPRVDQTPAYYNRRRLRAWFCFSDIEEATEDLLLGRRCVYTTAEGELTGDQAWMVDSLVGLRRSEPTLWILREANDG